MNYFELHIGDLTEATAHLSILEDGVYGRLMRKYYATEKPLPADIKQVQRLIGARSKEEREAVETVLSEFFELQDDGWHQSRCDAEIASFHEKQAGKEGKRESAKERQRRARERRANLFEVLRGHSIVPAWTTTTVELEALLSRVTGVGESHTVTPPVTRDDTATQTPDTKHQSPDTSLQTPGVSVGAQDDVPSPSPAADAPATPRGTRLAADWQLPKAWGDWALAELTGWTPDTVRLEAAKFSDFWHAKTGKDATKADWAATWRNWCRNAKPAPQHSGKPDRIAMANIATVQRFIERVESKP